jgi:hypothetical protein
MQTSAVEVSYEEKIRVALVPAILLDDGQPQGHLNQVIDGEYEVDEREADRVLDAPDED